MYFILNTRLQTLTLIQNHLFVTIFMQINKNLKIHFHFVIIYSLSVEMKSLDFFISNESISHLNSTLIWTTIITRFWTPSGGSRQL